MKRKKFIKMLMSKGLQRNEAVRVVTEKGIDCISYQEWWEMLESVTIVANVLAKAWEKIQERFLYGDGGAEPKGILSSFENKEHGACKVPPRLFDSKVRIMSAEEHRALHESGWKP